MRRYLLASTLLTMATAAHAQSLQTGTIGGMPYFLLPASGGCSAQTPCSVVTYLGVQSESAGAIANDVKNYFGGAFAQANPHTIVIAPQENGQQDATTNWGGYNTPTTPEQAQMVAVVQGVEAQMGSTVNKAASVVTGGSLGGTGTQAALIAYGPMGQVQPGVFSAGVSFDAADWSAASNPSQIAALCGVPLTAVHGTNDTNQNISFDQNLAKAINSNPACGNSFKLVPIPGAVHGTWSGPSGYEAGTGPGTPLATIASNLKSAPATTATASAAKAPLVPAGAATGAVAAPAATSAESPPTPSAASPNTGLSIETATIRPGGGSITDTDGHVWTITASGSIMEDGQYTPGGGGSSALTIGADGTVYGEDSGHGPVNPGGWFTLSGNGQSWQVSTALPSGATTVTTAAAPAPAQPQAAATAPPPLTQAPVICGGGPASGGFSIVNGQIIGPDGKPFIARGVNAYDSLIGEGASMTAMFPGLNFIRVGIHSYQDPSAYQSFVALMTSAGRVVEFENHPNGGGGQDSGPPGGIGTESAWYAAMAKAYASNPYVWFGTFNEPKGIPSLSSWQQATYQAIRGAGNNNPILIYSTGEQGVLQPGVYASMKNIIFDVHYYGGGGSHNTDAALAASIATSQSITSADGTVPALIGEYGDSMDGTNVDSNGVAAVTSVINLGASGKHGSAAWAYNPGGNADRLQNGGALTSPYGQMVALYINKTVPTCTAAQTTSNAQAALVTAQATLDAQSGTPTTAAATTPPAATTASPTADIEQQTQQQADAIQAQIPAIDAAISDTQAKIQALLAAKAAQAPVQ